MKQPAKSQGAFTLVEVLAALLVLALALSALQLRMATHLDSAAYLRDKTLATWVALDQLALVRIAVRRGSPPPPGPTQGSAELAGRTWYWVLVPRGGAETNPGTPVLFDIGVSGDDPAAARTAPLVTLSGVSDAWE